MPASILIAKQQGRAGPADDDAADHTRVGGDIGTAAVMLVLCLHLAQAPRRAVRLGWIVLGLIAAQGAIGYAQYFSGLPAGLVWVHVADSALIWIAVIRLNLALRDRGAIAGVVDS